MREKRNDAGPQLRHAVGLAPRLLLIEVWTRDEQRIEEVIARVSNTMVARAAFDEAVKHRPGRHVLLWQGAMVVAMSPEAEASQKAKSDQERAEREERRRRGLDDFGHPRGKKPGT